MRSQSGFKPAYNSKINNKTEKKLKLKIIIISKENGTVYLNGQKPHKNVPNGTELNARTRTTLQTKSMTRWRHSNGTGNGIITVCQAQTIIQI